MSNEKRPLRKRLRKHSPFVIDEVIVDNYVTELHAAEHFSDADKDRIKELSGRPQQEEFVNTLMRKTEKTIQKFLDITRKSDKQPQIYAEVMSEDEAAEPFVDPLVRERTDGKWTDITNKEAESLQEGPLALPSREKGSDVSSYHSKEGVSLHEGHSTLPTREDSSSEDSRYGETTDTTHSATEFHDTSDRECESSVKELGHLQIDVTRCQTVSKGKKRQAKLTIHQLSQEQAASVAKSKSSMQRSAFADSGIVLNPLKRKRKVVENLKQSSSRRLEEQSKDVQRTQKACSTGKQTCNPECQPPTKQKKLSTSCKRKGNSSSGVYVGSVIPLHAESTDEIETDSGRQSDAAMNRSASSSLTSAQKRKVNAKRPQAQEVFAVTCGESEGELHRSKFGSSRRSKCIKYIGDWLTPTIFHSVSSHCPDLSWKEAILFEGQPLQFLIDNRFLQEYSRPPGLRKAISKVQPTRASLTSPKEHPTFERLVRNMSLIIDHLSDLVKEIAANTSIQADRWLEDLRQELDATTRCPKPLIAVLGEARVGKSSLINALIGSDVMPVSGYQATCTAVPILIESVEKRDTTDLYTATIHFISEDAWERDCENNCAALQALKPGEEGDDDECRSAEEQYLEKLHAVYGEDIGSYPTIENLRNHRRWTEVKRLSKEPKLIQDPEREKLRQKIREYVVRPKTDSQEIQYWPLIDLVRIEIPNLGTSCGLLDLPGLADGSVARTTTALKYLDTCEHLWLVTDMQSASGNQRIKDLIKKIQARRRLSKTDEVKFDIIVTKSDDNADDFQIEELENFVGEKLCSPKNKEERAALSRRYVNERKTNVKESIRKEVEKAFPGDFGKECNPKCFTVSSKAYRNPMQIFDDDKDTEIPQLLDHVRSIGNRVTRQKLESSQSTVRKIYDQVVNDVSDRDKKERELRQQTKQHYDRCLESLPKVQFNSKVRHVVDRAFQDILTPLKDAIDDLKKSYQTIYRKWLQKGKILMAAVAQGGKSVQYSGGRARPNRKEKVDFPNSLIEPLHNKIAEPIDKTFGSVLSQVLQLTIKENDSIVSKVTNNFSDVISRKLLGEEEVSRADAVFLESCSKERKSLESRILRIAGDNKRKAHKAVEEVVTKFLGEVFKGMDVKVEWSIFRDTFCQAMDEWNHDLFRKFHPKFESINKSMKDRVTRALSTWHSQARNTMETCYRRFWDENDASKGYHIRAHGIGEELAEWKRLLLILNE